MTFLFDRQITIADFSDRFGKAFDVQVAGHQLSLTLHACQELPGAKRAGGAFRLEFLGPVNPQLGQGVFVFRIDSDQYEIFIVPVGPTPQGMKYEAIFY
ncbi:MAG TPA: hypothetical protein VIT38_17415 [Allosphingosinicella sp.]